MAHEVETMTWTGKKPWHGLGVEGSADRTPVEILMDAGLAWETAKVPLYYEQNGLQLPSPASGLIRTSDAKYLDTVSGDWEPVQNIDAVDFLDPFFDAGIISMETAGSLKGGQNVFFLGKMKEQFEVVNGDVTQAFLLFTNFHKYGFSTDIRLTPIRVECNNMLTMALRGSNKQAVKVTHRAKFDTERVQAVVAESIGKLSEYEAQAKHLAAKRYDRDSLREYFAKVYPAAASAKGANDNLSRVALQAIDAVDRQPGARFAEGSWYQAYNAVTYISDHVQGRTAENRLYSSWYGPNQVRKLSSLKLALDYADKSPDLLAA